MSKKAGAQAESELLLLLFLLGARGVTRTHIYLTSHESDVSVREKKFLEIVQEFYFVNKVCKIFLLGAGREKRLLSG